MGKNQEFFYPYTVVSFMLLLPFATLTPQETLLSGARREKGLFYGFKLASRHARESTLSAIHVFRSSGQRLSKKA